jgi:hypothetical protein
MQIYLLILFFRIADGYTFAIDKKHRMQLTWEHDGLIIFTTNNKCPEDGPFQNRLAIIDGQSYVPN